MIILYVAGITLLGLLLMFGASILASLKRPQGHNDGSFTDDSLDIPAFVRESRWRSGDVPTGAVDADPETVRRALDGQGPENP